MHKHFLQLDWWKTARLAMEKPSKGPVAAPAEGQAASAPLASENPAEKAAREARMKAQRDRAAAAARQTDPDADSAERELLTRLGDAATEIKITPVAVPPLLNVKLPVPAPSEGAGAMVSKAEPLKPKPAAAHIETNHAAEAPQENIDIKIQSFFSKYRAKFEAVKSAKDDLETATKLADIEKTLKSEDQDVLAILGKTQSADAGKKWNALVDETAAAGKIKPEEIPKYKAMLGEAIEAAQPKKEGYTLDETRAVFENPAYKEKYDAFMSAGASEAAKKVFLDSITDERDKAIVQWAFTAEATEAEKAEIRAKLGGKIPETEEALTSAISDKQLNYRERMVSLDMFRADQQALQESADSIAKEAGEAGGIVAVIERIIKAIEKLIGKLESKWFGKKEKPDAKFGKSPVDGDKKIILARKYEQGKKGVDIKAPAGSNITVVMEGKVIDVGSDFVKMEASGATILYSGIKPMVAKDAEVAAGSKIGTMAAGKDQFNFQVLDKDGKQFNPESLLGNFTTEETEEDEKEPEEAAFAANVPPLKLESGMPLKIWQDFAATGNKGVVIEAPRPSTTVQNMAPGKVILSSGNDVRVQQKDGTIVTYHGLQDNNTRIAAGDAEVAAETQLGVVGLDGKLTISIEKDGVQKDPAPILLSVLPKPAETPEVATAPGPAAAPSAAAAAPAPAPAAQAPQAAPTLPKAPEAVAAKPTLEQQLLAQTNEALKEFLGKTIPLDSGSGLNFKMPYIDKAGNKLGFSACTILGNIFTIDGRRYEMKLPFGAKLKNITISGFVQEGDATIVAGSFGMEDSSTLPVRDLLGHIEKLRAENPEIYPVKVAQYDVTFNRLNS